MPELTDPSALQQRIIQESKRYQILPPQEGEFTFSEFMDTSGSDREPARKILLEMELKLDWDYSKTILLEMYSTTSITTLQMDIQEFITN